MKKNIILTYIIITAIIASLVGLAAVTIQSTIKTKLESRSTYLDSNSTYISSLTIENSGNDSIEGTFNISIEPDTKNITILCTRDTIIYSEAPFIFIKPNESITINMTITTDTTLIPGEYDIMLRVKAGAQESLIHVNTEKISDSKREIANTASYSLIVVIVVLTIILFYLITRPKTPQQSKNINKPKKKETSDHDKKDTTKDSSDNNDVNMFDMLK